MKNGSKTKKPASCLRKWIGAYTVCISFFYFGGLSCGGPHTFDMFQCSCNRSRKHMWTVEGGGRTMMTTTQRDESPFCFNAGCLKKINTFLLLYTNCELFLHRCCLTFRERWMLLLLLLFLPFPSLVQLSPSQCQCQFHFSAELQKKPSKFCWYFLIQFFFRLAFRHRHHVWWINIGFFIADGFHSEAIKFINSLYCSDQETEPLWRAYKKVNVFCPAKVAIMQNRYQQKIHFYSLVIACCMMKWNV